MSNTALTTVRDVLETPATWLARRQLFIDISLPAVTTFFGLHILRVLIQGMYLGFVDRFKLTLTMALIAVGLFVVIFWLAAKLYLISGKDLALPHQWLLRGVLQALSHSVC